MNTYWLLLSVLTISKINLRCPNDDGRIVDFYSIDSFFYSVMMA